MADLPLDAPVVGIGRSSLLPKPDTKNLTAYGGAEGEAAGQGGTNPSPNPNPSPSPSPSPNPNPNPNPNPLTRTLTLGTLRAECAAARAAHASDLKQWRAEVSQP